MPNRQQRRAQPQRTKPQWLAQLVELSKSSPGLPDDLTIASLLLDVIVTEQRGLQDESLAVLCGLAAAHFGRASAALPAAQHVNAQGERIYTEADVAKHVGIPIEQVRAHADELMRALGADSGISLANPADINPLH